MVVDTILDITKIKANIMISLPIDFLNLTALAFASD